MGKTAATAMELEDDFSASELKALFGPQRTPKSVSKPKTVKRMSSLEKTNTGLLATELGWRVLKTLWRHIDLIAALGFGVLIGSRI